MPPELEAKLIATPRIRASLAALRNCSVKACPALASMITARGSSARSRPASLGDAVPADMTRPAAGSAHPPSADSSSHPRAHQRGHHDGHRSSITGNGTHALPGTPRE